MVNLLSINSPFACETVSSLRDLSTAYNFMHTSSGKNDECYTQRYAVEPLLEFMEPFKDKIIWCPFDTIDSEFVKVFTEHGYNVEFSHICYGQDFYKYEPKKWDVLISNPPFTNKKSIFERAISFNKPFALIMNVAWLNDSAPSKLFSDIDLQLLIFDKRMTFDNQCDFSRINFSAAYFCWNFLPKQIIMRKLNKPRKQRKARSERA